MALDLDAVAAAWGGRGFSCGLTIDPPGHVSRRISPEADQLIAVVDGELEVVMGGQARRLAPGDQIFIPALMPHTVTNAGASRARWLHGSRQV